VRRPVLLASIVLLAGALIVRRRRRAAGRPLGAQPRATALTPTVPGPDGWGRFVSVPWELVAAPDDEPALTIRYRAGAHMELDRVDAQETPTQVFVTVLMRRLSSTGGGLAQVEEREAVVRLGHPLGARELVHAPVDEPGDPPLYP
jgi:hypothetical protein